MILSSLGLSPEAMQYLLIKCYEWEKQENPAILAQDFPNLHFKNVDEIPYLPHLNCTCSDCFLIALELYQKYNDTSLLFYVLRLPSTFHFVNNINSQQIEQDNVDLFFNQVHSLFPNELQTFLSQKTKQLIQDTSHFKKQLIPLHFFLLSLPIFHDMNYFHVFVTLTRSILQCHHGKLLQQTIHPRLINWIHQMISVQLFEVMNVDENIAYLTRLLGIFYDSNQFHYKLFYNETMNQNLDLKQDYRRWIQNGKLFRQSKSFEQFNFLSHPYILDLNSKSKILKIDSFHQQHDQFKNALIANVYNNQQVDMHLVLKVKRDALLQSSMTVLLSKMSDLKKPLRVYFQGEEGIDQGGVRKEWFQLIIKECLNPDYGIFQKMPSNGVYWFTQHEVVQLELFQLVGMILALAIYNHILIDVPFPLPLYKKLLQYKLSLEDLKQIDSELAHGLEQTDQLLDNCDCYFEVEYESFGKVYQQELLPNGSQIKVTRDNVQEYIDLYVDYKCNQSIAKQFEAFEKGFKSVIDNDIIQLFRPEELELLIRGSPVIDLKMLQVKYEDGYSEEHWLIKAFWEIIDSFSVDQKKKFLKFFSGSDRVPCTFDKLELIVIRNGQDSEQLPTAHTCFNYLMLPEYHSKEKLKNKLELAMENYEGFGLK